MSLCRLQLLRPAGEQEKVAALSLPPSSLKMLPGAYAGLIFEVGHCDDHLNNLQTFRIDLVTQIRVSSLCFFAVMFYTGKLAFNLVPEIGFSERPFFSFVHMF